MRSSPTSSNPSTAPLTSKKTFSPTAPTPSSPPSLQSSSASASTTATLVASSLSKPKPSSSAASTALKRMRRVSIRPLAVRVWPWRLSSVDSPSLLFSGRGRCHRML